MTYFTKTEVHGDAEFTAELAEIARWPGVVEVHPGGSRYTVTPPVLDTDMDILVQSSDYFATAEHLDESGFKNQGRRDYHDRETGNPISWRKGEVNVLLFSNQKEFLQRAAAAEFCRAHNVQSKGARAGIHQVVRGEIEFYAPPDLDDDLLGGPF